MNTEQMSRNLQFEAAKPDKPFSSIKGFSAETLPGIFLERCARTPDNVAFREKNLGIYQEVTWKEYHDHVENCCLGLVELGLKRGDRVALMGDPCPEWLYFDLGALCAGAIGYGVYPTSPPDEVEHLIVDGGANIFFAEDQEFVDKALAVADRVPSLRHIIVADTRALFAYDDPRIFPLEDLEEMGARAKVKTPNLFTQLVSQVHPDDICTLIYTSGTTGKSKGVAQTHRAWLWGWCNLLTAHPCLSDETATCVAYMPLAHLGRFLNVYLPIIGGFIVHFGESVDTMQETLFDVAPTFFFGAPRTYEKFASQMLVGIDTSSWVKRISYNAAMSIGRRYIKKRWQGKEGIGLRLAYRIAYWIVFRPILDKLGLIKAKWALMTAAPVPPKIATLWQIWGLNVAEAFGQTEAGFVAIQRGDFPQPGNAGFPGAGVEVRLTQEGEVLSRSPANMAQLWRNEEGTAEVLRDGWIWTGDVGRLLDGDRMQIYDRIKDIAKTTGGKRMSPSEVEISIKSSAYIIDAAVFADGRKYPTALIEIDFDTVSEWARENGISYTSFSSLASNPEVYALISRDVEKANEQFSRVEQVKRFRVIPKELDPEDEADPITPTRKIQRRRLYEKFSDLVESMYTKSEEDRIVAEVKELDI